jgi:Flp pilus assembly protein TadG
VAQLRRGRQREHGQALIMFVLSIVVIMAFASIVIDLGLLRTNTARLQNALDAGALAGAQSLPAGGSGLTAVTSTVSSLVTANYSSAKNLNVTYYCLLPIKSGSADTSQIAFLCPGFSSSAHFSCNGTTCDALCGPNDVAGPSSTEACDMVGVTANDTQPFAFGQLVGVPNGTINGGGGGSGGGSTSFAANAPSRIDVVVIMDRTGSMSGVDTSNARAAALTMVEQYTYAGQTAGPIYNPTIEWLAYGLLGPSAPGSCTSTPAGSIGTATMSDLFHWVPVGLSGQNAPAPATGQTSASDYSKVISAINCVSNSGTGTDLADPFAMAQYELDKYGSPNDRWGIILETDGQPNAATSTRGVTGSNYCAAASTTATNAKADSASLVTGHTPHNGGIQIYTIGFGLDGSNNTGNPCPDSSAPWHNQLPRSLLVSAASAPAVDTPCTTPSSTPIYYNPSTRVYEYVSSTTLVTNTPVGSTMTQVATAPGSPWVPVTNHFFCSPKSTSASSGLTSMLSQAASSLASGSRLVQLPVLPPVITSMSPSTLPVTGGTVTISGKYFTSVYSVAGASSFTVVNDTTMTAVMPAHAALPPVSVTATNGSGVSNAVTLTY